MLPGFDAKPLKRESRRAAERAQTGVMTGEMKMWPVAAVPAGWLACNGQAVSRQAYAALFGLLQTTYGAGDGSTTFNLPNYVDRMPIGTGNLYAAGATGGSKDAIVVAHSHGTTELPHIHGTTEAPHAHTVPGDGGGGGASGLQGTAGGGAFGGSNTAGATTGISINGATTGLSVNSAGASGTNANLPPYLGVNFIIKT